MNKKVLFIALFLVIPVICSAKTNWIRDKLPKETVLRVDQLLGNDSLLSITNAKDSIMDEIKTKDKIREAKNFLKETSVNDIVFTSALLIDNVYDKPWKVIDKEAFSELTLKDIVNKNIFKSKKVREDFYSLLTNNGTSDDVVIELGRYFSDAISSIDTKDFGDYEKAFDMLRKVVKNKERHSKVKSSLYREFSTVPLRSNLQTLLEAIHDNDSATIESVAQGLNKFIRNYRSSEYGDKDQKDKDYKEISDSIITYLNNLQNVTYKQKFLFLPLGATNTVESKKWLKGQLLKSNYTDYSFVLPALNGRLTDIDIEEILNKKYDGTIPNIALANVVIAKSLDNNLDQFNTLVKSNKTEYKKAYLTGLITYNYTGKKVDNEQNILSLLSDSDPIIRENAVIVAKLNLPNHYNVLSEMYKTESNPKVKYILQLYGYHMPKDKKKN